MARLPELLSPERCTICGRQMVETVAGTLVCRAGDCIDMTGREPCYLADAPQKPKSENPR